MNQPTPGTARARFAPVLHELIDTLGIRFIESDRLYSAIGSHMSLLAAGSFFPTEDVISVRADGCAFYATKNHDAVLLHEIGHWTGMAARCARPAVVAMFYGHLPSEAERYQEEAVAELTAVKLLKHFGLGTAMMDYSLQMMLLAMPPMDPMEAEREADKAVKFVLDQMAAKKVVDGATQAA